MRRQPTRRIRKLPQGPTIWIFRWRRMSPAWRKIKPGAQGIDEAALNLESLANEHRAATPVADFDESHLVNADAGVADVIDFVAGVG